MSTKGLHAKEGAIVYLIKVDYIKGRTICTVPEVITVAKLLAQHLQYYCALV